MISWLHCPAVRLCLPTNTINVATTCRRKTILSASVSDNEARPRIGNSGVEERKRAKPSIARVQQAIGAGIFRDADPRESEKPSMMDLVGSSTIGKSEGPVEKKLRQTGEWLIQNNESASQKGQETLLVVCLWILPIWVLLLSVASGLIKLPFSLPFLDEVLL